MNKAAMFKCFEDQIDVLGVCVDEPLRAGGFSLVVFHAAYSGRRGVEMMRQTRFDLLLVGAHLPDMAALSLVQQARMMRARPNWAMIGGPLNDKQKVMARAYGAETIFDLTPSAGELANLVRSLREKAIQNVLDGQFGQAVPQYRMAA